MEKYNNISSDITEENLAKNINLNKIEINDNIKKYIMIFIFNDSLLSNQFVEFLLDQKDDENGSAGDIDNFLKSIARLSTKLKAIITNLIIKKILENPKNKLLLDRMKKLLENLGVDINNLNLGEFIEKIGLKDGKNISKNSLTSKGNINIKKVNKKIKKLKSIKKSLAKSSIINKLFNKLSKGIIKDKSIIKNKEGGTISINGKTLKNSDIEKTRKKLNEIDKANKNENINKNGKKSLLDNDKIDAISKKLGLDNADKSMKTDLGIMGKFINTMTKLNEKLLSSSKKLSNVRSKIRSTEGLAVGGSVGKAGAAKGSISRGDGLKKMSKPEGKKPEGNNINSEVIKPKSTGRGTIEGTNKTLSDGNEKNKLDSLVEESKKNINNDLRQKTEVNSNREKVVNKQPETNITSSEDPNKLVNNALKSVDNIFNPNNNSNVSKNETISKQDAFGGGVNSDGRNNKEKGDVLKVGENVENEKEINNVNNKSNDEVEDIDDEYGLFLNENYEEFNDKPTKETNNLKNEMNDVGNNDINDEYSVFFNESYKEFNDKPIEETNNLKNEMNDTINKEKSKNNNLKSKGREIF